VEVDYSLPVEEIAPLLIRLTTEAAEEEGAYQVPKEVEIEVNIAKEQKRSMQVCSNWASLPTMPAPNVTECCCK